MDPSVVCRACLTTISLEYIDLETPLYNDTTFLECFNFCTKLQATLEDELPNNICVACGKSLQIAYDFIKASSNADQVFRDSFIFFEDLKDFENEKTTLPDVNVIIKKEDNDVDLLYHTEYIEEEGDFNVEEIKVECLPEFEVVISNEESTPDENNDTRESAEDDVSKWPVVTLEDDDNEMFYCNICQQTLLKDSFEEHTNMHLDNKPYKCDECEENFFSERSMGLHKKSRHKLKLKRENFICGWCGEAFNCRLKLNNHKAVDHQGQVPTSCLTCGEKFSEEKNLRLHVKKAHGIPKESVPCPYCNKKYKNIAVHIKGSHPDILKIYVPSDGTPKLFNNQCPHCFRNCLSKNALKDHLNTHTGERPYSCSVCEKTFHLKAVLNRHNYIVHQSDPNGPLEKCPKCDFTTTNRVTMDSHKGRHRRPLEKKYLCSYCPSIFVNPKKLYMHEDLKHGTGEKAFQCDICKKKFIAQRKLKEHIMCVHVSGRPHECQQCKKTFKNDFQLKAHEKLHNGKQIDCPHCEKKFARGVDFKIHMRTHTGEQPYECHLCDKRYAIKVRLTYHLQKHMGYKHKCQHCTSEFNSRAKLRLHMFKHIGMPYICDYCQSGYPNRIGLRRHAKNAHKIILSEEDLLANRQKNAENVRNDIANAPGLPQNSDPVDELEI